MHKDAALTVLFKIFIKTSSLLRQVRLINFADLSSSRSEREKQVDNLVKGFFLACCVVVAQAADYRTFTDTQGRAIQARLLDANTSKGEICLEREDGKKVWVSPAAFSEGDQTYIRSWAVAYEALSGRLMKIDAEPVSIAINGNEQPHADNFKAGNTVERWSKVHHKSHYTIEFQNTGDDEIPALGIECHSYVKLVARGSRTDRIRVVAETLSLGPIEPGEHAELSTRETDLKEWLVTQVENVWNSSGTTIIDTIGSRVTTHDERLEGLWIRISVPLSNGEEFVHDVCFPDDLKEKVVWDEQTVNPFPPRGSELDPHARPALPICTLAFIQERGRPGDRNEFGAWMNRARGEMETAGSDTALLQQVSDGMDLFYLEKFDTQGRWAWNMGRDFEKVKAYALALHWYERSVQTDEYHLVFFTEMLASSAQEGLRNGELALKYALIALDKDKKSDERIELLARAYARNGQFDLAIKTQEEAIARLMKSRKDEQALAIYQGRLELYRKGEPFTDKPKR